MITLKEFRDRLYLDHIAEAFPDEVSALQLLEACGFPRSGIPSWGSGTAPRVFWEGVARQIALGAIPGGLDSLLVGVLRFYPYHPQLAGAALDVGTGDPVRREEPGIRLRLFGSSGLYAINDRARELAGEAGLAGSFRFACAAPQLISFWLPGASPDQVLQMANQLEREGLAPRWEIEAAVRPDFLLRQIRVEGPDQSEFLAENIPASTRVKDIGRAVIGEHYEHNWPNDRSGLKRSAVIDRVDPETGREQRLVPEETLEQGGVRDGDTLHIHPESTAGAIHPQMRDEALARARSQLLDHASTHGVEVLANAVNAPTEYVLRFVASGWGPPSEPGGEPVPVDRHEVLLLLPEGFPMQAPAAFWQTPVFHPNIHRPTGKVCLGVLEDHYRPGLHFGDLCQVLVDIARYHNCELREVYDAEAREWALTPAGQAAIESRGGRSALRQLLIWAEAELAPPPRLRVRRLER